MGVSDTPLSTIVRESAEEASLDPLYVRSAARSVGVISYPNRSPEGWILPGLYYLFDLQLPDDRSAPRVNEADGEVECFELMSTSEVLASLHEGRFKPSSALALVDFLIRHGHVTAASEPRFAEVCMMLRRDLVLPVPWR
jgi:8-oxo-dGTP pyrophosphatase MutT (NUDIX family)